MANTAKEAAKTVNVSAIDAKTLDKQIDAAIKSDNANAEIVKDALASAILFAAGPVGRIQPLNRLVQEVTIATREGIRQFVINVTRKHGIKVKNEETGKDNLVTFLKYSSKNKSYSHNQNLAVYKEAREAIAKLSIDELKGFVLGSPERDASNRVEEEFNMDDFEAAIQRNITKAIKSGAITSATAGQFNKLLSAAHRVDPAKVAADALADAAKAAKRVATLNATAERIKANMANENNGIPAEVKQEVPANQSA